MIPGNSHCIPKQNFRVFFFLTANWLFNCLYAKRWVSWVQICEQADLNLSISECLYPRIGSPREGVPYYQWWLLNSTPNRWLTLVWYQRHNTKRSLQSHIAHRRTLWLGSLLADCVEMASAVQQKQANVFIWVGKKNKNKYAFLFNVKCSIDLFMIYSFISLWQCTLINTRISSVHAAD